MLRPKQKNVDWMDDRPGVLVLKPAEHVLNTCDGTLATETVSFQVPERRMFVGCKEEYARFESTMQSIMELYVKQMLRSESDLALSEEAVVATNVIVEKSAAFASRGNVDR